MPGFAGTYLPPHHHRLFCNLKSPFCFSDGICLTAPAIAVPLPGPFPSRQESPQALLRSQAYLWLRSAALFIP